MECHYPVQYVLVQVKYFVQSHKFDSLSKLFKNSEMVPRNQLTMCRLCLSENECFVNIFEMNDWQGYVAADAISDLFQFHVSETDGYPHVVCLTCLTKLTDFKQFKECCQKSKVTYDEMFVSHGSLVEHKPKMVEIETIKTEPVDHLADEENFIKACSYSIATEEDKSSEKDPIEATNDIDATDVDEFNEEPMEDQLTLAGTAKHPQYLQRFKDRRPYYRSNGENYAPACTWNISTDEKSTLGKSKIMSLNVDEEASSSREMERFVEGDADIGKEGEEERGMKKKKTGEKGEVGTGTAPGKIVIAEREKLECYHCGKLLVNKKGLKQHMKLHGFGHSHGCDICGKLFQTKGELKRHALIHTGSKPYKCEECGKCFRQNGYLIHHMSLHPGSTLYKCMKCNKRFSTNEHFVKHMSFHDDSKLHKCMECGKTFSRKEYLIKHMRIHTGCKPYKCIECCKCFSRGSNLKKHMRTHWFSEPFICVECNKSFNYKTSLNRHMKSHTGSKQ